ncbi:MAG: LptA/OstA family protein [Thermodesulfobacteriota bacterium]|nr:LptA/OstA family protein [Thermodesulfobacteriota bacterium]
MKLSILLFCLLLVPSLTLSASHAADGPNQTGPGTGGYRNAAQASGNGNPKIEQKAAPKKETEKPINITSDLMEADDIKKVVIFTGNVVARQEGVVINCDLMRVYYKEIDPVPGQVPEGPSEPVAEVDSDPEATVGSVENNEKKENEIDRIEVEGHVKITRGDRVALSDKAVYLAQAKPRVIILTGEPRIWRNKDVLTGKKITVFLDSDFSIVEGGDKQRVNATFFQKSKDAPKTRNGKGPDQRIHKSTSPSMTQPQPGAVN